MRSLLGMFVVTIAVLATAIQFLPGQGAVDTAAKTLPPIADVKQTDLP